MSLKKSLAKALLFAVLELGALGGVPIAPRHIAEILETMNRPKIQHVIRDENDEANDHWGT